MIYFMLCLCFVKVVQSLYPRVFNIAGLEYEDGMLNEVFEAPSVPIARLPKCLPVTSEIFDSDGIYLMDDGTFLWLYVGRDCQRALEIFGLSPYEKPKNVVINPESYEGSRLLSIIQVIRDANLIKQGPCQFHLLFHV